MFSETVSVITDVLNLDDPKCVTASSFSSGTFAAFKKSTMPTPQAPDVAPPHFQNVAPLPPPLANS